MSTSIRVYRDDNSLYEESEYLAVINNQDCYLVELLSVHLFEWDNAIIRFVCPTMTPHPGLLDNTISALDGWHFLLDTPQIKEVQNWDIVVDRPVTDVIIEERADHNRDTDHLGFELARIALSYIRPIPTFDAGYPLHFASPLANHFTDDQLREAITHLIEGKTVEFRYLVAKEKAA